MVNNNHYDRWLLITMILLLGFGAIMIYSSTSVITPVFAKRNITTPFFYFKRHIFTMLIGIIFMFIAYKTDTDTLKKTAIPLLVFSFVLLLLVFIPKIGVSTGGARRWIRLWPSTFQPSELVKLAMVIFLSWYMSRQAYRTDSFWSFAAPIGVMGAFQLIFLKQPDFGAAMSLGVLTLTMLAFSGTRLRYILMLSALLLPVIIKLVMEPYRMKRVLAFLNPWNDQQGGGFQLVQSFIALGSGGLTGVGLGESRQKLSFLPESHTDFIFSLIGEELGFVGAVITVCLFFMLFIRGVRIANSNKDIFSHYLASGLTMMIALQALINFAVATGLVPTKGLPLPFISYGGSSLLINMVAVGILLNLSKGNSKRKAEDKIKELIEKKKAVMSVYGRKPVPGKLNALERL